MYKMDVRPLLKAILDQFFGPSTGLIDMIVQWIPSPAQGAALKVSRDIFISL
jgi:U5 small nuclear ribonucleoprotein component